jgi:hypothetical protein
MVVHFSGWNIICQSDCRFPTAELERLPSRRESPGLHHIGATSARVRFDSLGSVHAPTDLPTGTGTTTSRQICGTSFASQTPIVVVLTCRFVELLCPPFC